MQVYNNVPNIRFDLAKFHFGANKHKGVVQEPKYACIDGKIYKCCILSRSDRSNVYAVPQKRCVLKVFQSKDYVIDAGVCTVRDGEYVQSRLVQHIPYIIQPLYSCSLIFREYDNIVFEMNVYTQWDGNVFDLCVAVMKSSLLVSKQNRHEVTKQQVQVHEITENITEHKLLSYVTLFVLHVLKSLKESTIVHTDIKLENILYMWHPVTKQISLILADIEGVCVFNITNLWKPGQGTQGYRRARPHTYPDYSDDAYAAYRSLLCIINMQKHIPQKKMRTYLLYKNNKSKPARTFITVLCDRILPMLRNQENTILRMQRSISIIEKLTKSHP